MLTAGKPKRMVDRGARDQAAELVGKLRDGLITNQDFEDFWPSGSGRDGALGAVRTMLWHSYSDYESHKLTGPYYLDESSRDLFDRCELFLRSDLVYEWPDIDFSRPKGIVQWVRIMSLGLSESVNRWIARRSEMLLERLRRLGDFEVWPFIRGDDYVRTRIAADDLS